MKIITIISILLTLITFSAQAAKDSDAVSGKSVTLTGLITCKKCDLKVRMPLLFIDTKQNHAE